MKKSRVYGLVWGAALADALGEFYEGSGTRNGEYIYVPDDIIFKREKQDWTDDTDQLLLLLDSILEGNGVVDAKCLARHLKDWHLNNNNQHYDVVRERHIGMYTNFVLSQRDFLSDPIGSCHESYVKLGADNASNGSLMRNAICGITSDWINNTIIQCRVTHPDIRCILSCLVQSYIIHCAFHRKIILWGYILGVCRTYLNDNINPDTNRKFKDFQKFFRMGMQYAQYKDSFLKYIKQLNIGNYEVNDGQSYSLLCMTLCMVAIIDIVRSSAIAPSTYYETRIKEIISLGGDADTNATVVGAIIGCYHGIKCLPQQWIGKIENAAFLQEKIKLFVEGIRL